jgi:hypothetical protein
MPTPPPPASRPRTLPASSYTSSLSESVLPGARAAGVTLLEHDRPKMFAYTNGEAPEVDQLHTTRVTAPA